MSNYKEAQSMIWQQEHDQEQTGTKKVLLYGWDYSAGVKRRISVNSDGELNISGSVSTETYEMLIETGDSILIESGDTLLIEG